MENNEVHAQLVTKALHLMTHYQDDLTKHDLDAINKHPDIPFIHGTRSSGTHIWMMHPHDSTLWPGAGEIVPYLFGRADREHILTNWTDCMRDQERQATHTWHHYNGRAIVNVSAEKMIAIWTDYERRTLSAWRRDRLAA